MTLSFSDLLEKSTNTAYTENGALSNASTLDSVLNLFAQGGAYRGRSQKDRENLIRFALGQDFETGLRALFYLGDVREGQGERALFKTGLRILAEEYPAIISKIVDLIPEYGRWDYLYVLKDTPAEKAMIQVLKNEHQRCLTEGTSSLMYKWLKSVNTSSKESRKLGRWTAKVLGYQASIKGYNLYQKDVTRGRALLGDAVVEVKMTANLFDKIDYSKVPAKASLKYKKSFLKRDTERFVAFHQKVAKGEAKINTATLYPHEVVHAYKNAQKIDQVLENTWDSMRKEIKTEDSAIYIVDVSGSMYQTVSRASSVLAVNVAHALGLFGAESLSGPFKDKAILFSSRPQFLDFSKAGKSLFSRLQYLNKFNDCSNTDLQASFDLILNTAVENRVAQEELPNKVIVISDMEFDPSHHNLTNFDAIKAKFARAGYVAPQIVFWNVTARTDQFPATKYDNGVALISGYSPSIMVSLLSGKLVSPIDLMLKVLNTPRYDKLIDKIRGL